MLTNRMAVYSRKPLYRLNERMEIETLLNIYDSSETVQIWFNNVSCITIKINDRITVVPETGDVLFTDQQDIIKYKDILNSNNLDLIISNSANHSKINKRNEKFTTCCKENIKGLFSIEPFDDICINTNLMEMRYIDSNNIIKKIQHIDVVHPEVMDALSNYIIFHSDICDEILMEGRLIFEIVKTENKTVTINHFIVTSDHIVPNIICYTPLQNYPVFPDQYSAKRFRFNCGISNDKCRDLKENMMIKYDNFRYYTNKEISRQTKFRVIKIISKYLIISKKTIIKTIAKFLNVDTDAIKEIPFIKLLDSVSDNETLNSGLENISNKIIDAHVNKPKYADISA